MSKYKTAMGKTIDMSRILAKNEHIRAVGNMSVNARGDTIDSKGNVVVPVTKKVGSAYQKTVTNRTANIVKNNKPKAPIPDKIEEELSAHELEFQDTSTDDAEIELIKKKTEKKNK